MQRRRSIPNSKTCHPRSVDGAGHFTLLICRGRQRNVQTFITFLHSSPYRRRRGCNFLMRRRQDKQFYWIPLITLEIRTKKSLGREKSNSLALSLVLLCSRHSLELVIRCLIRCGFIIFHSGERNQKYPDSLDARGRKPYLERKSCRYMQTRL